MMNLRLLAASAGGRRTQSFWLDRRAFPVCGLWLVRREAKSKVVVAGCGPLCGCGGSRLNRQRGDERFEFQFGQGFNVVGRRRREGNGN